VKRFRSVFASAVFSVALLGAGPTLVSATTTCKSTNSNYVYYDILDDAHITVTLHAKGCYTGSTSYGQSVRLTFTGDLWYLGSSSSHRDPTFETSPGSGNTFFSGRPVFHVGAGNMLLASPELLLSTTGGWTRWDTTAKVCDDGSFDPVWLGESDFHGVEQLGPLDLQSGSTSMASCTSESFFQPVYQYSYLSSYT
jgi:hypothetical protein